MQRYFIEDNQIDKGLIKVQGNDAHHIKNVMRQTVGDRSVFIDSLGNAHEAILTEIRKETVLFSIDSTTPPKKPREFVTIAQALIRKDRFELVLEKATELGAYAIIPTVFTRSIIRLDEKDSEKKLERYRLIAKESSEQSERDFLPIIKPFTLLKNIRFDQYDHVLVCYARETADNHIRKAIKEIRPDESVLVVIGPEGGISPDELAFLEKIGARRVSLGHAILRSETASAYVLSAFLYEWGH